MTLTDAHPCSKIYAASVEADKPKDRRIHLSNSKHTPQTETNSSSNVSLQDLHTSFQNNHTGINYMLDKQANPITSQWIYHQ